MVYSFWQVTNNLKQPKKIIIHSFEKMMTEAEGRRKDIEEAETFALHLGNTFQPHPDVAD